MEYLKCRTDLNFEVDFWSKRRYWCDCDQVVSYFIWIMDRPFNVIVVGNSLYCFNQFIHIKIMTSYVTDII